MYSIMLLISSSVISLIGAYYLIKYNKGLVNNKCLPYSKLVHSAVYVFCSAYIILIFNITAIYKILNAILYLKYPRMHYSMFLAEERDIAKDFIDDYWQQNRTKNLKNLSQ